MFSLLCSLLVALTLVPMLGSRFLKIRKNNSSDKKKSKFRIGNWFKKVEAVYSKFLEKALGNRKVVYISTLLLLVITLFLLHQIQNEPNSFLSDPEFWIMNPEV